MSAHHSSRKIVIINQAANNLTIGFANAFNKKFSKVALITGSVHVQGEELDDNIKISWINHWQERPAWKKFGSYLIACLWMWWLLITRYRKYEVIFVSIPPMAYLLNLILPHRFSLIIWDIYPDAFKILGMKESHLLYRTWSYLNKHSFNKAYRLFTIGTVMRDALSTYVDISKIIVQPIWSIFQENNKVLKESNPFVQEHSLTGKFVIQYSGNIGLSHKVETLVDIAEYMKNDEDIIFQIIGRGPRKPHLEKIVAKRALSNCKFLPFQSDEMFPYSLSAADVGVVILDEETSKGAVPSKSYNLMAYGIPGLYIASSDSELYYYTEQYDHARCFSENQLEEIRQYILKLKSDTGFYSRLSENSLKAAKDFTRKNADRFVDLYL